MYLFISLVNLGIVGKSYRSDIAIDDVILSPDCYTNGSRIFPTPSQCTSNQFACKTSGQCISSTLKCDGAKDCKDGSDELLDCRSGTTGKSASGIEKSTGMIVAGVVGGLIILLIIVIILYMIVKRKKDKKLHLFSVFYDPTKQPEQETSK